MKDLALDRDVQRIVKRLNTLPKEYAKHRRKMLKRAAKPVVEAIKSRVPTGGRPHKRYRGGKHVATYYPGNLKRSIRTLVFRGSKNVYVGPRLSRTGTDGTKGNKVDGYYGHMVEYGTVSQSAQPFMRPGFAASKRAAQKLITNGARDVLRKYSARYRSPA